MINFLSWLFSALGIYEVLRDIWTASEEFETGISIMTKTDSVICIIVSAVLAFVLLNAVVAQ